MVSSEILYCPRISYPQIHLSFFLNRPLPWEKKVEKNPWHFFTCGQLDIILCVNCDRFSFECLRIYYSIMYSFVLCILYIIDRYSKKRILMNIYKTIKLYSKLKHETIRQYFVLNILWLQAKLFQYLSLPVRLHHQNFLRKHGQKMYPLIWDESGINFRMFESSNLPSYLVNLELES